MDSPAHSELAYSLTDHHFGSDVATLTKILFSYDQVSLKLLRSTQQIRKIENLKKALLVLVKYQLVDYVKTVKNYSQHYEYSIMPQRIFHFFRVPRFIYNLGLKDGQLVAVSLSILFEKGLLGKERWTRMISSKLNGANNSEITEDRINEVVNALIFRRFVVDIGNNVCLNIDRLYRDYRDDLIIDAVDKFYNNDPKIKALIKAILVASYQNTDDDAPITAPVPFQELVKMLCPIDFNDQNILNHYLNKLSSENNFRFVVRSGFHPNKGHMYALNLGLVIDYCLKEHLCSLITTRFGPKCCRVFRLLILKGPLLLKQIEECIMLPARDVREYAYMLIKEGFIRNRQVPKTPDNAPGKSVFIMSVELDRVVYNLADLSCRSVSNLLTRYNHELSANEALLSRSRSVQELLKSENLSPCLEEASSLEVWNQYFNSHEIAQLNQINRKLDKMLCAKTQVDETLLLSHVWIRLRPHLEINT